MVWIEYILIGYCIVECMLFVFGLLFLFEYSPHMGYVYDYLDEQDFNIAGNIVVGVITYIIFFGLMPIDMFFILKELFSWHPKKKEKKIKLSQADVLNALIDNLDTRVQILTDKYAKLNKDIEMLKESVFIYNENNSEDTLDKM